MRRDVFAKVALCAVFLLAPPLARACDPDELNAHLTTVCRAALDPAVAVIVPLRIHASAEEDGAITLALARATEACDTGDPAIGAAEAVRLARLAGRIEARTGTLPAL
ncbi:MAG: hypothetical protein JWO24_929 [Rhodospirillales bacterium]|jgi:hypothetical protein|nr:hypothetical protein [Rhodospirillales bacterium]